ncbi:histone deacetylase [Streptomyces axinellae]|uniref:Uncharacterized protein n=1 Tax=Streptomyces axinellae TaxID=552788 RepID=A0ABN3QEA4_9ACTN
MPEKSVPVELPSALYFATVSAVWGGGRAFYDPESEGPTLAVAHLVTPGQFADIAAQEMYRPPGTDLDLASVLADGRATLGDGRYETLVHAGTLRSRPVLTFTAPWRATDVPTSRLPRPTSLTWRRGYGSRAAGAWSGSRPVWGPPRGYLCRGGGGAYSLITLLVPAFWERCSGLRSEASDTRRSKPVRLVMRAGSRRIPSRQPQQSRSLADVRLMRMLHS